MNSRQALMRSLLLARKRNGFSLIELMVALAIIGILLAVAVPNYREYVVKANRRAAQQYMLTIANKQAQYLLDNRAYATVIGSGGLGLSDPPETSGKYTFALSGVTTSPLSYTIAATAVGGQVSDGSLTLDSTGAKTPSGKW